MKWLTDLMREYFYGPALGLILILWMAFRHRGRVIRDMQIENQKRNDDMALEPTREKIKALEATDAQLEGEYEEIERKMQEALRNRNTAISDSLKDCRKR